MITKQSIFMLLVVALLAGVGAHADVWLSNAGNDANDGLTAGTPKATLGAALTVLNGQTAPTTLHIAAGTYQQNAILNVSVSGSVGNPVIIQGEGGPVTIRQAVLNITGAFVTVQNISFDAMLANEACIVVRASAADCTINNCQFTGVAEQVFPAQHFNTETTEEQEPEDVAPIQIMAANRCTVTNCTFNSAGQTWDFAVLMPSATGGAQDLLVQNCTIEGATTGTGGVKILRAAFNARVLNCTFNNIATEAFSLQSHQSAINSGTSVGITIQNCTVNGGYRANSQRGIFEIYRANADNVNFLNLTMTSIGSGGADGIKIASATCTNVTIDGLNYDQNLGGGTRAISITNDDAGGNPDGLAEVCYVRGLVMRNMNINTRAVGTAVQFWNYPKIYDVLIENVNVVTGVAEARGTSFDWYSNSKMYNVTIRNYVQHGGGVAFAFTSNALVSNFLIQDSTFTRYAPEAGGNCWSLNCNVDGLVVERVFMDWINGNDAIAAWVAGYLYKNITIRNSTINSTRDSFVVADTAAEDILIEDCVMNSGAHCVVVRRDNAVFRNLTVRRCNFNIVQLEPTIALDTTWGAAVCARIGTARFDTGLIEDVNIIGHRGVGFYDIGVKENLVLRRVVAVCGAEGYLSGVGNVLRNSSFEDCYFEGTYGFRSWQNLTTFGPCIYENITMTGSTFRGTTLHGINLNQNTAWTGLNASNCVFEGQGAGLGSGSLGIKVEVGSTIDNATFTNCNFVYSGAVDDATDFRMGGFLLEDPGTGLSNAGFQNCNFAGGNAGFIAQRFRVSDGVTVQPTVTNVLLNGCSFQNCKDRAVSMHFAQGSNVVLNNCSVSGALRGHAVFAMWNGNGLRINNLNVDGAGVQAGIFMGTSGNASHNNWSVTGGTLANLAGVGIRLAAGVRNSSISGVTLAGVGGSSHGIYIDNSAASGPGAAFATQISVTNTTIAGFGGDGIRAHGSSHTISGCTVAAIGGAGIYILDDSTVRPVPTGVTCSSNQVWDCVGAGVRVEGQACTIANNTILRCGQGIQVRSGLSGVLGMQSNTFDNSITRNLVFGGIPASATGIWETTNPGFGGDPGPHTNFYVNNTVTDWAQGTEFRGLSNRIQNNIFFFNTGTDFRVLPSGIGGLMAGWNCAGRQTDTRFDGIYIDFTKDIWYNPELLSRDPANANFYRLGATSPCLDRGTTNGLVADGVTDLGAIETGASGVASWRLY